MGKLAMAVKPVSSEILLLCYPKASRMTVFLAVHVLSQAFWSLYIFAHSYNQSIPLSPGKL